MVLTSTCNYWVLVLHVFHSSDDRDNFTKYREDLCDLAVSQTAKM